jgi:hypothetical protein
MMKIPFQRLETMVTVARRGCLVGLMFLLGYKQTNMALVQDRSGMLFAGALPLLWRVVNSVLVNMALVRDRWRGLCGWLGVVNVA